MASDAAPDRDATPEEFLHRAELLADLGRYEDAVAELRYALALEPANAVALTLLARVQLAAGRPDEALPAAEAAMAADGSSTAALGARAMALIDLRRFGEAAELAEDLLRRRPDDADALCLGAGILSESRNGQHALDAAWRAVQLAPRKAQAHLVLGVVAARLQQFQLAERAYREALELDPDLAQARHDIGVIRLEQRRYSEALEELAAADEMRSHTAPPGATRSGAPASAPGGAGPKPRSALAGGLRSLIQLGAAYALITPVLVACAAAGNGGLARFQAAAMGVIGLGMVGVLVTRLPGRAFAVLPPLMRADRALAVAVYAVAAPPFLVLLYALVGSPWPLVLAVVAGFTALIANAAADY